MGETRGAWVLAQQWGQELPNGKLHWLTMGPNSTCAPACKDDTLGSFGPWSGRPQVCATCERISEAELTAS